MLSKIHYFFGDFAHWVTSVGKFAIRKIGSLYRMGKYMSTLKYFIYINYLQFIWNTVVMYGVMPHSIYLHN